MAVALRLSRGGSKKRPFFRIVAADVRAPRDGKYLERLGTYNPMKKKDDPERIFINKERIKHWLSVGAKPTERVAKFLALDGLVKKPDIPKQTKKDKPRKKTLEKVKAKEEKLKRKENEESDTTNTTETSSVPPKENDETAVDKKEPSPSEVLPAEPQPKNEVQASNQQTSSQNSGEKESNEKSHTPSNLPPSDKNEISKEQNVSEVKSSTQSPEAGVEKEQNNKPNSANVSEENKPNKSITQSEEPVEKIKTNEQAKIQETTDNKERLAPSNSETQSKETIIEKKDAEE